MKLVKQIGVCLVLISLLSACKKDEKNDDATNLALLLALSGGSTCTVTAGGVTLPVASVSSTQNGGVSTIALTTSGAIGIGAIQIPSAPTNSIGLITANTGSLSLTVYKGTCPITAASSVAVAGVDYTFISGTATVTTTAQIRFNVAGSYTIIVTSNGGTGLFQLN
ncbi:hypothetical protein [Leptospira stimsonii]|uniref:Lipoprotein n=1 Tax=Leptospira stimsonii TaxID=2202203 RepID=A0ABY2MXH9_9LEPT|nr:hypothetical protein [Leptospira stimsonii]TGK10117.1 hypothetical protein EHO98_23125 [Leptospira stimsonii]TGM10725.1 hypothetical protein EHQ90_17810 [Leptospira stimsonii]